MQWGPCLFLFPSNNPTVSAVKLLSATHPLHATRSRSQANIIIVLRMDPLWFTDFKETEIGNRNQRKKFPLCSQTQALIYLQFNYMIFPSLILSTNPNPSFSPLFSLSLSPPTWQHICDHRAPVKCFLSFFTTLRVTLAVKKKFFFSGVELFFLMLTSRAHICNLHYR